MALFKSHTKIDGVPLNDIISGANRVNGIELTEKGWAQIRAQVIDGGARIIRLRGRSSFQSPGHQTAMMVKAAAGGETFEWPCGAYLTGEPYHHVMMAMPVELGSDGVQWTLPQGDDEERAELDAAYAHLEVLRDETIEMGILPPVAEWVSVNPHLA